MQRLKLILLFYFLFSAQAQAADVRLSLLAGLGSSSVTARGATQTESPGALAAAVDTVVTTRMTLGLEHARTISMGPVSSAVSSSGFLLRYYILNYPARSFSNIDSETSYLQQRSWAAYIGTGLGFSQSSLLPKTGEDLTNAVAIYGKARAGLDIPMADRYGFQTEFSLGTTLAGSGAITTVQFLGGLYYFF